MPNFDEILQKIGDFERFQIINYLLLCFPIILFGANSLTYVFKAGIPNYRCFVEGCDNATNPVYAESWVSAAIPASSQDGPYVPDRCLQYIPQANFSQGICQVGQFEVKTTKCDRWVFEDNERTIVGDFNITCAGNQWKLALVPTAHFLGVLFGGPISAFLADRFGRKFILVCGMIMMSITGIAQVMSNGYLVFQFLVFCNAFLTAGMYPLAFILAVELVGPQKREMVSAMVRNFHTLGEVAVGVLAWLFKDWVITQLVISIPAIIGIAYYWLVPESIRWLLANNKSEMAGAIVRKAAAMNGVTLPLELAFDEKSNSGSALPNQEVGVWFSVKELLRSRVLCVRFLLLCIIWMSHVFIYYGTSIFSTSLGGSKYLNFILVSLVEIPGNTLSWWTMKKLGRRWSMAGFMLLCSVTFGVAAILPDGITFAEVLLFTVGKFGVSAAHGIAYTYTAELHPTVIRSVAVATCSSVGRIGGLVAPFVPLLTQYSRLLPSMLFGGVSLLAAVCAWWLPETVGSKLPDTVAEALELKQAN